ncbi:MAG: SH3 domain-containing protein [Alphaproteobacteria bacterium]
MTLRSVLRPAGTFLLPGSLAVLVAACAGDETQQSSRDFRSPVPGAAVQEAEERGPLVIDAAQGSRLENVFVTSDTERLSRALWKALVSPDPEKSIEWANPATGAAGEVKVRKAYLTNVENVRGGRMWAPTGLDTAHVLDPAQGEFTVTGSTVNVRVAPSLKGARVAQLGRGTVVDALGREGKNNWLLVARRGNVLGYIYAPLLESRGGDDLMLAGAAARRPVLCRDFEQSVIMPNGVRDEWESSACRAKDGDWRVVEDVLGFTG